MNGKIKLNKENKIKYFLVIKSNQIKVIQLYKMKNKIKFCQIKLSLKK